MTPWLHALLVATVPPGHTAFSVRPVEACIGAEVCEGAKRSSFYRTWVRQETPSEGAERYETITTAYERAMESILCVRLDQSIVPDCVPDPVALDRRTKKLLFGPRTATAATFGLVIQESGLREDVQVGRGSAKPCPKGTQSIPGVCGESDDGGRGRGPANECGFGQQHPKSAWMVADADAGLRARAKEGDPVAREAICQSLVGTDAESIERSFRATLRFLYRAYQHCGWSQRVSKVHLVDPFYAMYSLYGTGSSCISGNDGKTLKRFDLFRSLREKTRRAK